MRAGSNLNNETQTMRAGLNLNNETQTMRAGLNLNDETQTMRAGLNLYNQTEHNQPYAAYLGVGAQVGAGAGEPFPVLAVLSHSSSSSLFEMHREPIARHDNKGKRSSGASPAINNEQPNWQLQHHLPHIKWSQSLVCSITYFRLL